MDATMDYLALDRPKIFMPVSPSALAVKFPDCPPTMEAPWHPCFTMDARPTLGAQKVVLVAQARLDEITTKARPGLATVVDEELESLGGEAVDADIAEEVARARKAVKVPAKLAAKQRPAYISKRAAPKYSTRRQYRAWLIDLAESTLSVIDRARHTVIATRVAVMTHSISGDWATYASSWDPTPKWPCLDEPDALALRIAFVERMARDDVIRLNLIALGHSELSGDEVKKSKARPDSSTKDPTAPTKSSNAADTSGSTP